MNSHEPRTSERSAPQLSAALVAKVASISRDGVAVAFSGGVDSAVVAQAAQIALQDRAMAVTAVSASVSPSELSAAQDLARQIGIRHILLQTHELDQAAYVANAGDRCFYCKTELYAQMAGRLAEWNVAIIANGTNADDLEDYRPGLVAAANFRVVSPLADCGITKAEVRAIARLWHLPVWDKPAAPCLASRIAPGVEVTAERLRRVDAAEAFLREAGFRELRVRHHADDLARIEVPAAELMRIANPEFRQRLLTHFESLGFRFVTLDLAGFRSGSLNPPNLVQVHLQ